MGTSAVWLQGRPPVKLPQERGTVIQESPTHLLMKNITALIYGIASACSLLRLTTNSVHVLGYYNKIKYKKA